MKILVFALVVCLATSALLTSKHFEDMGFNMSTPVSERKPLLKAVKTSCENVALSSPPYNYNGTVKSGYLSTGRGASALAFIFYGKENVSLTDVKKYPTLIWLNGGPGSSSQLGNLMELGPFWLVPDDAEPYKIVRNNWTWVRQYNVLFVDQPVGTGLSYADASMTDPYVHNMTEVAADFYNALHELYVNPNGCFPGLGITSNSDLFIFGESYAGKYVPAIAAKIVEESQKGGFLTGLRGIAIGDGFTVPYDILAEVTGFAYNIGLLDYQQRARIEQIVINATYQSRMRQYDELHNSFESVLDKITTWAGGINVYDFTKYYDYPTAIVNEYFMNPDVKALYRLSSEIDFGSQGGNVYKKLFTDFMVPYAHLVEYCLQNIPVLIYNGQNDIIVENPGTMRWVEQLHFDKAQEFRSTLFKTWKVNDKVAGSVKKAGNLEFRIVNNAGHLVPMDQGENALAMVKSFVEPLRNTTKLD